MGLLDAVALTAMRATSITSGRACRTNDIQMVSTDHCPFCMKEQKEMGRGDFSKIPNGIGSVEHRMDLCIRASSVARSRSSGSSS